MHISHLITPAQAFNLNHPDPFWSLPGPPEPLRQRVQRYGYRTFDHLVWLTDFEDDTKPVTWALLLCHCGSIFTAPARYVARRVVRSCGCRHPAPVLPPALPNGQLDLTDRLFGLLRVLAPVATPYGGPVAPVFSWRVQCACGVVYVTAAPSTRRHCGAPLCAMLYKRGTRRAAAVTMLQKVLHK